MMPIKKLLKPTAWKKFLFFFLSDIIRLYRKYLRDCNLGLDLRLILATTGRLSVHPIQASFLSKEWGPPQFVARAELKSRQQKARGLVL